jgi:ABC-2 type transport system ATP-binding protein
MDNEGLIITEGLTKHYGRVVALDSLSLEIRRGEVFGLLGPNGSGKTTTIRLLLGLLRPTAGRATLAGLDCWRDSLGVRRLFHTCRGS